MQFQPSKVLSKKVVQQIAKDVLVGDDKECIDLGELDFSSAYDLVVELMDAWCQEMDKKMQIARVLTKEKYGKLYRRLIYERGLTFSEFRCLFDGEIPESEYILYTGFEFLQIQSDRQRRLFIGEFECNVENYVKLLSKTNTSFWSFFLSQLRSMIPVGELKKHAYISGKTGSGKSELLKTIFFSLQKMTQKEQNYSLVVLDPHGDLVSEIRQFSLNKDRSRLVYIDPFLKNGYSPVFNPLELKDKSEQSIELTAQILVDVFKELVIDSGLSMQMGALLMPCIATLLRKGDATLADLQVFMNDKANKSLVTLGKRSPNKNHANFFENGFYDGFYTKTKIAIYTRLLDLLNTSAFYNLVCGKSTIHLDQLLDGGKVILFNLAKGVMGKQASSAFGRFVIASTQAIAQKRAIKAKSKRVPIFAFIDECQNYITPSINTILTESRKFGLHLILVNQSVLDLPKYISTKVLGNTAVKITGRNDIDSLRPFARNLNLEVDILLNMPKYHFYLKTGDRSPFLFGASNFLVQEKAYSKQYYLSKEELKEQDSYFIEKSGYYQQLNLPQNDFRAKHDDGEGSSDFRPKFDL